VAQVGAGAEGAVARTRQDNDADLAVLLDRVERRMEGIEGARGNGVHGRIVERHARNCTQNLYTHQLTRHSVILLDWRG
jgi:retron-type reverse transcriptase